MHVLAKIQDQELGSWLRTFVDLGSHSELFGSSAPLSWSEKWPRSPKSSGH